MLIALEMLSVARVPDVIEDFPPRFLFVVHAATANLGCRELEARQRHPTRDRQRKHGLGELFAKEVCHVA